MGNFGEIKHEMKKKTKRSNSHQTALNITTTAHTYTMKNLCSDHGKNTQNQTKRRKKKHHNYKSSNNYVQSNIHNLSKLKISLSLSPSLIPISWRIPTRNYLIIVLRECIYTRSMRECVYCEIPRIVCVGRQNFAARRMQTRQSHSSEKERGIKCEKKSSPETNR